MKRVDTEFSEKGPFLPPFLIFKLRCKKRDAGSKFLESFYLICITTIETP